MRDLTRNRLVSWMKYALSQYKVVKKMYKQHAALSKKDYKAFGNIANIKYPVRLYIRNWRQSSIKCSSYMQNVAKGSLCAMCDNSEYKRFSSDIYSDPKTQQQKKIIYVPVNDAWAFASNCGDHIANTLKYIRVFQDVYRLVKYRFPAKATSLEKLIPIDYLPSKLLQDSSIKNCQKDKSLCEQKVLDYYMNGPLTRLELKWLPFLEKLQIISAKSMDSEGKKGMKLVDILKRRRILMAKMVIRKERDWS